MAKARTRLVIVPPHSESPPVNLRLANWHRCLRFWLKSRLKHSLSSKGDYSDGVFSLRSKPRGHYSVALSNTAPISDPRASQLN